MGQTLEGVKLQQWPGGLYTITGGTRIAVKLDRPWQVDIEVNPESCPFCTKPQDVIEDYNDWVVLPNAFTPYPTHRLVIPKACMSNSDLRILGGIQHITKAMSVVETTVQKIGRPLMLHSVHCGYLAGQNLPHLHHHVLDNEFPDFKDRDASQEIAKMYLYNRGGVLVFEFGELAVIAGGHRAGQCYIVPVGERRQIDFSRDVSQVLFRLIEMFARKFRSSQGLPPDFMYSSRFRNGRFVYGKFIPILNNWGATEYLSLEGEQPFTLPWPHEETVRHLLS